MQEDKDIIRIGTSPMTPAQLLMQLWPKIQQYCPDMKFQIIPFENTPENAREILANLGKNIDVVGGIFDETMLSLRSCAGLQLSCEPLCCAVSVHHRLAAKDKLQVGDLYEENLLLMRRGWTIMWTGCAMTSGKIIIRYILWILNFIIWTFLTAVKTAMMCCWQYRDGRMCIRFLK